MGRISFGMVTLAIGLVWLTSVTPVSAVAPQLTARLSGDLASTNLTWTGEPGPSGYFLMERSVTGSETAPRVFEGIGDLKVSTGGPFEYRDAAPRTGWNCYRVRAKADNFEYSNEACVIRPVVDGPGVPDAGNSPSDAIRTLRHRWELTVGGFVLLLVSIANWLAFRGYR